MVIRNILFVFFCIFSAFSHAETFTAEVDRTNISEHESLVLTVRYSTNLLSGNPDFSPLEQQFEIVNQHRKNSFQLINGQSSSWTIWTVMLTPKRKGNLVIPSLEFKGEKTKPIQINVSKTSDAVKNQDKEVFFHTETDVKQGYVQGQIIYTEKLYFAKALDNSQLNEMKVADAVIQSLGEIKHYPTRLNGRRYDVYERKYAIFPQTSGELIIPGPRYTGEISNGPWRPGRPISVSHPPIRLQIKPQPTNYPQATWLPAKTLVADYRWSGNPLNLQAGEPATLQLSIRADGLSSAQLPPIPITEVESLKYYPDQAVTDDTVTDQGITGSRQQNIAIVPTRAGTFTLPEIRIPWWNTETGKLEYAVIPAQRITAAKSTTTNQAPKQVPAPNTDETASIDMTPANEQTTSSSNSGIWPWLTLLMTLLWLVTLYLWWKKPAHSLVAHGTLPEPSVISSEASLKEVKKACRANDANSTRTALLHWAQGQLNKPIGGLDELMSLTQDESLKQALKELDYTLYSNSGNSAWQGEYFWQLVKSWKIAAKAAPQPLADLYPRAS